MNLFAKKALYLALFMVVAVGFQSFAADLVGDLDDARAAVAAAEREYAVKEEALAAAKASVMEAKTDLANAEAAFAQAETALANAKTALDVAKAAEAEALAKVEAVEAEYAAETASGAAASSDTVASGDTPAPAATGGGSTSTTPPADTKPAAPADRGEIPDSIRNNQYFLESERYLALAQETYLTGDYDTATYYAEEAARLARLSDEYIAQQMGESWSGVLPATYTVREWDVHGDCFWNIAGQPWAYNDPHRWRVLYEANKEKLPNPNNANIVEPGTVLTIPSIKGETRQGEWVSGRTYEPLR